MKSILQTKEWAQFKSQSGWKTHQVEVGGQSISILERELVLGKTMAYAPEASLENTDVKLLQDLSSKVRALCPRAIFFKLELFDILGETENSLVAQLRQAGYQKSFEEVQPEHRQWVDISGDETTILARMKEKGRYNTRLALRKGVTARISTDTKDVDIFYSILRETAVRDGFSIRSQGYFHALCNALFQNNLGELVIAEFEGTPLAALIITYYDGLAGYLYGASSNQHRNLMAPYAAHFAAIQSAKRRDCVKYDLLQIAPIGTEGHKYTALTRFKQQLGGEAVALVGGWDFVFNPLWYQLFKFAEAIRRK